MTTMSVSFRQKLCLFPAYGKQLGFLANWFYGDGLIVIFEKVTIIFVFLYVENVFSCVLLHFFFFENE